LCSPNTGTADQKLGTYEGAPRQLGATSAI
jgi:hypothetical protein